MAVLSTFHVARLSHRCNACHRVIHPGQPYQLVAITPGGDTGYEGWLHFKEHYPSAACTQDDGQDVLFGPDPDCWQCHGGGCDACEA